MLKIFSRGCAAAIWFLSSSVMAAVSQENAAQLGVNLTPLGAEKAGNASGSIPEWTGGLPRNAAAVDGSGFLADPFSAEKPLFTITADNVGEYKEKLSPGQLALFKRYPTTYKMNIYPTHRTVVVPDRVASAVKVNATSTELVSGGSGVKNFTDSYAFPIPKDGQEAVWNHLTRYRGGSVRRNFVEIVPDTRGAFTPVRVAELLSLSEYLKDSEGGSNVYIYVKQAILSPARLAGSVLLFHETLDQVKEPRMTWQYNAGQRRVRRAPQLSYDGPSPSSDGQRTIDNFDVFNGATDRYEWKLVGKKEMYISYNNYRLASPSLKYSDIAQAGHINQDIPRYELHRVWHVEATLKEGARHIYAKRDFYIDEDTWQIAVADHYDGRGNLWRVGESHSMFFYNHQVPWYAAETLTDVVSGRYALLGLHNEEGQSFQYGVDVYRKEFTPAALRQAGVR